MHKQVGCLGCLTAAILAASLLAGCAPLPDTDPISSPNRQETAQTTVSTTTSAASTTTTTAATTTTATTTTRKTTTTTAWKITTTTAKKTTTKAPATTTKAEEPVGQAVYITPKGERYHLDPDCGGKNSSQTTLDHAISIGRTPCKKCAQ